MIASEKKRKTTAFCEMWFELLKTIKNKFKKGRAGDILARLETTSLILKQHHFEEAKLSNKQQCLKNNVSS